MKSVTDNYKSIDCKALAQDTPLIILDEPTTHLDLLHKVALFKLLKKKLARKLKNVFYSLYTY
jgi:iron complex transport system ATP-binding protein